MGMFINTNVAAIGAQRNLSVTEAKMSRALERLSSGLRINRAADDAAGLSISEGLRSQIRGLRQASRNAQDGVSMIQTAEGALTETHALLQRMRELTVQAANATLGANDRTAIGSEISTLKAEIDNIATRTKFNGQNLLTGALSVTTASTIADITATGDTTAVAIDVSKAQAGTTYTFAGAGAVATLTNGTTNVSQAITLAPGFTAAGQTRVVNFDALGVKLTLTSSVWVDGATGTEVAAGLNTKTIVTAAGSGNAVFRVGAEVGQDIAVSFNDNRTTALGTVGSTISTLVPDDQNVSTVAKANTLLTSIDNAIVQVSSNRAKLGAAQNQVEAAINSLGVAVENMSASESRIRDADVAEVSTELVTRQIMQQAGVAVLSQANTSSQSALSLLQR
jgi:flagellin